MDYEKIRELLEDRVLKVVSEKTNISERTLQRIKAGEPNKPHPTTLKVLGDYLAPKIEG